MDKTKTERIFVVDANSGKTVGELVFEKSKRREHATFRYASEWLESPRGFPIEPALPLTHEPSYYRSEYNYGMPGSIADTAPDGWGRHVIETALGRGASDLEVLLYANDFTRIGCYTYVDENGRPFNQGNKKPTPIAKLTHLVELNEDFIAGSGDTALIAKELLGTGNTIGGARPKSTVDDDGVLTIAKYTIANELMPTERMEVATLQLAAKVGLRASTAKLALRDRKRPVAIIQRFDRRGETRVPYISARTMMNVQSADETAYYTNLAEIMRSDCGNGEQAQREIVELFRRIAFTILVSNTDDHTKNHGFLRTDDGRWVLSPAFDINPQPYRTKQLKMGISELSGLEPSIESLIDAAPFFDIETDVAAHEIGNMAETIQATWRSFCKDAGMNANEIDQYRTAFDHPQATLALQLRNERIQIADQWAKNHPCGR